MKRSAKTAWFWPVFLACAAVLTGHCLIPAALAQSAQIQGVKVLSSAGAVEIEIQMSQAVAPRSQVVADPERLVIDFPGATPGPRLRALAVNRGEVAGVRVGLFESNPPTTRVVLDLKSVTPYQIFPSGRSVMIKLGGTPIPAAGAVAPEDEAPPEPPKPKVTVGFQNGLLSINADKATLAEVLYEIHTQTGAEIAVPAGAEQEQVFTALGPAPPKDVLAALLDGSPYNFILVGSSSNPNALERVLLSRKGTNMVLDVPVQQSESAANMGAPAYGNRRMAPGNPNAVQATQDVDEQINSQPPDEEPQAGDPPPAEEQPAAAPGPKN
jgi:hypothetical protein